MGAAAFGKCFATSSDAADYAFSTAAVSVGSDGYTAFEYRGDPLEWNLVTYEGGAQIFSRAVSAPTYPECIPGSTAVDGIALGFLVVLVWAATFAVTNLRRAL